MTSSACCVSLFCRARSVLPTLQGRRESRGQEAGEKGDGKRRSLRRSAPPSAADASEEGNNTNPDDPAAAEQRSPSPAGRSKKLRGKRQAPDKEKGKDARPGVSSPDGGGAEGAKPRGRAPAAGPAGKKRSKSEKQPRSVEKEAAEEEDDEEAQEEAGVDDGPVDERSPSPSPAGKGKGKGKGSKNRKLRRLAVESDRGSADGSMERSDAAPAAAAAAAAADAERKAKKRKKSGKRKAEEAIEDAGEPDDDKDAGRRKVRVRDDRNLFLALGDVEPGERADVRDASSAGTIAMLFFFVRQSFFAVQSARARGAEVSQP